MKRDGIGIVELLVVIAVIGVTFLAMASSQFLSFKVTRTAQETAAAKDIAARKMEQIRGYGYFIYADCNDGEGTLYISVAPGCKGKVTGQNDQNGDLLGHDKYTLTWTIDNTPVNPRSGGADLATFATPPLISISVTASWGNGSADSYSLQSYLSCADAGEFSFTGVPCPAQSMEPPKMSP